MRRFRIPEIGLGALLAVSMFVMDTTAQTTNPKNDVTEAGSNKDGGRVVTEETEARTNRRIADYNRTLDELTFFLVLANVALWLVTWRSGVRQSRDMKAALAHAEKAFATAERAFVFIDGFNDELATAVDSNPPGRDFTWLPAFYQQEPGLWISRSPLSHVGKTAATLLPINSRSKLTGVYLWMVFPLISIFRSEMSQPHFFWPRGQSN